MGKSIYRLLDEAYKRITDFSSDVGDVCFDIVTDIGAFILAIVIYGTFPLWVIPYKIARKRKKPEETISKKYWK